MVVDERVGDGVHIAAVAVQEREANHGAAELELVEPALRSQPQRPDQEGAGEPTRVGRGDRGTQRVVVERMIALEGQPAYHPLLLLLGGEGRHRTRGDEQSETQRTQRTPTLAGPPRTVNLLDT